MKTTLNHLINNRSLTTFTSPSNELTLNREKNYLFDLSYLKVIDVIGDKTLEFLQGQLTCDINSISDIQIIQGAQCNLKGRILALMDILSWNGVKLILPEDLTEPTINSLNKVAMLSRVSLQENKTLKVLGFYLQNQNDLVPDTKFFPENLYGLSYGTSYCYYHLGNGYYIFLAIADFAEKILKFFANKNQLLGSLTWHTLRLAKQQFTIYPESRGMFLPHRLDLHQTPYLSFNKGCYKGQEIIARMHYKATLKHELKLYIIKTEEKLYSGQKLSKNNEGGELGELVDFAPLSNNHYLVALSVLKNMEPLVLFDGHTTPVSLDEKITHYLP